MQENARPVQLLPGKAATPASASSPSLPPPELLNLRPIPVHENRVRMYYKTQSFAGGSHGALFDPGYVLPSQQKYPLADAAALFNNTYCNPFDRR